MPLTQDSFMLHLQSVMYQLCIWKHAHIPIHNTPSYREVTQLSQRNRSAGWVSFGWVVGDGVGQTILCTKRCRCQKTKALIFYTINPLLYENGHCAVLSPSLGAYSQRTLFILGSLESLLVVIELFSLGAMAQALLPNVDWESPFLRGGVTLAENFRQKRTTPTNHLCTYRQASECLTTLPLRVFAQRNFVADFLREKAQFLYGHQPFFLSEKLDEFSFHIV